MDDLVAVAVENSRKDLPEGLCSLLFAEALLLEDLVKELSSCAELSDDVEEALLLVELKDLDDVGVVLGKPAVSKNKT